MKSFYCFLLIAITAIAVQGQEGYEYWYDNQNVPRAGEQGQEIGVIPGSQQPAFRELDYDSLNMRFSGNWPYGQSFSVSSSVTGDTVFIGAGGAIIIVDASDPYNPVQLSEVRARAIIDASYYDASSGLLFLAAYFSGVEIWDVSDITTPQRLSRIPTNSYPRGGVYARDGYLYVVTVADGFYVADISDPSNPSMISHQIISGSLVWTSFFEGNYAYLSQGSSGFKVVDFSDPMDPSIAGVANGTITGIHVVDQVAYVSAYDYGIRTYDVSDPSDINEIGELELEGYPYRIVVAGDYAYVASSTTNPGGGVQAIDISDPANPVHMNTYAGYAQFISGSDAVIATTGNVSGGMLLDISDPASPQFAADIPHPWSTVHVGTDESYAYVGNMGFRVFDMSDPANPVQVGYNDIEGEIAEVADNDTLAVFIPKNMSSGNRVNIMSIADPDHPYKLGHYSPPVMTYDLALQGHYAYVACWWDGCRIADFSNPESPVLVAHEMGWVNGALPGEEFCYVQAVDVWENYLYILDYGPFEDEDTEGLYLFDISDPANPVFISRYADVVSRGYDMVAWGNHVYIADQDGGMEIVDVSDPEHPISISYTSMGDVAWAIDISWPFVYIANYINGGVQVFNVTNPADPTLVAYYLRSGCFALGVTAWDNYALIADGPAGMQVYDFLLATDVSEEPEMTEEQLSVFPNPTAEYVKIRCRMPDTGFKMIGLFTIEGKKIWEKEIKDELHIDISKLPAGVFFVRMQAGDDVMVRKLIVK